MTAGESGESPLPGDGIRHRPTALRHGARQKGPIASDHKDYSLQIATALEHAHAVRSFMRSQTANIMVAKGWAAQNCSIFGVGQNILLCARKPRDLFLLLRNMSSVHYI